MNTLELKASILERIVKIEDNGELELLFNYLLLDSEASNSNINFWNSYSENDKNYLVESFKDSENSDNWLDANDVLKKYQK